MNDASDAHATTSALPRRPSDLEVEQWRLGELSASRALEVARALKVLDDPRRHSTDAEDAALFERLPPTDFAEEVTRRAELANRTQAARQESDRQRRADLGWVWAPVAVAAVLLFGFLIWRTGPGSGGSHERPGDQGGGDLNGPTTVAVRDRVDREVTRIKGLSPQLVVRVQDGGVLRRLEDGDAVANGDVVQLSYVAAGKAHGVIVSIDGAGIVTLHQPSEGTEDTRITQRKETPVAHSYELDDAPDFERFLFVTADKPLAKSDVVAAAEMLAEKGPGARGLPLKLDGDRDDVVVVSVLLTKEAAEP